MCYVQDLVRAILLAAETQTEKGEFFFCLMAMTTGWRRLVTSSRKRWR
jgi:nucleoside-diphosphate-sugar epimerase